MNVTFEPVCYSVNSTAMGDTLAAVPVVKYAIETYHKECDYRVVASKHFRDFFHFVPDSKFLEIEDETWKFDKVYSVRMLNDLSTKGSGVCRLTPSKMTLSHYASIGLMGRILTKSDYNYIPLIEVDVSRFGVDFSNSVILVASYRDENRSIRGDELLKVAEYLHNRGITPIYVGKTDKGAWKERPPVSPFIAPSFGVDLRNKTTIPELATIISKSLAIIGTDSGVLHLAGTTKAPIIASYTNVDWKYRIPVRAEGTTIVVEPDPECRYCSSHWLKDRYDFLNCFQGHINCVKSLTADKYIRALDVVLGKPKGGIISFSDAWETIRPCFLGKEKSANLYNELLNIENVAGDIAEIGVYKGNTSKLMKLIYPKRTLHCYDSFCGMVGTTDIDYYIDGEFSESIDNVRNLVGTDEVEYHIGTFPESYVKNKFAFVHIDLDSYSGTKDALDTVYDDVVKNGIILVDDYKNPNCAGVEKAITEWMEGRKKKCIIREYKNQYAITKKG